MKMSLFIKTGGHRVDGSYCCSSFTCLTAISMWPTSTDHSTASTWTMTVFPRKAYGSISPVHLWCTQIGGFALQFINDCCLTCPSPKEENVASRQQNRTQLIERPLSATPVIVILKGHHCWPTRNGGPQLPQLQCRLHSHMRAKRDSR